MAISDTKLPSTLKRSIGWYRSLAMKMFRAAPVASSTVVITTMAAQVFQILAMLLPIKVVILMGSSGIPRFFPSAFQDIDREELVVGLSVAAAGLYIMYLLATKAVAVVTHLGAERLSSRNLKLAIFPNQGKLTRSTYQSVASASSALLFAFAAWVTITVIYPRLGALLAATVFLSTAVVLLTARLSNQFLRKVSADPAPVLGAIAAIGIFASLALLVGDYLAGTIPPLLVAFISILLARQMLTRIPSAITVVAKLRKRQAKINALFFHGIPFSGPSTKETEDLYQLLKSEKKKEWLAAAFAPLSAEAPDLVSMQWLQLGIPNVLLLDVVVRLDGQARSARYFVKVYAPKRAHLAEQECTLLAEPDSDILCPNFLYSTSADNLTYLVFDAEGYAPIPGEQSGKLSDRINLQIAKFRPSRGLVRRFVRSRDTLNVRLQKPELIEHLKLTAASADQKTLVERFAAELPDHILQLQALPLAVVNPDVNSNTLFMHEDGRLTVMHWGKWALEPIGSVWTEPFPNESDVEEAIGTHVAKENLISGQLLYRLDRLCARQRYRDAIELIAEIHAILTPEHTGNSVVQLKLK